MNGAWIKRIEALEKNIAHLNEAFEHLTKLAEINETRFETLAEALRGDEV